MFFPFVILFLASLATGSNAQKVEYMTFAGLGRQIPISTEVQTAMSQLNRYCGNGGYSYRPSSSYYRPSSSYYRPSSSYYRPTSNGPNLGSLISPVVFGLATGAGIAAVGNLLGK